MKPAARSAALGLALLAGCAAPIPVAPPGPMSSVCQVQVADAFQTFDIFNDRRPAIIRVGNDGGWCGYRVVLVQIDSPQYWEDAAVTTPPAHGEIRLRQDPAPFARDTVHLEYRASPGATGSDDFTVQLQPGFTLRHVHVEIVPAATGPVAQAQAQAQAPEVGIVSTMIDKSLRLRFPN